MEYINTTIVLLFIGLLLFIGAFVMKHQGESEIAVESVFINSTIYIVGAAVINALK